MSTRSTRPRSTLTLLAVLVACMMPAAMAMAATSATVNLSGAVSSTLAITATATAEATALDLDGDGSASQHIVMVADLAMSTNNETGLTLTASSGNLSKTGGSSIAYQVTSVADAGAAPAAGDFTIASGSNYTVGSSAAGSAAKDLYIMYTPATLQDPGTYTGSISLTVADN